ncbi:MAG: SlyX protein [Piscirickettsiaceae bacterium CG_4_9_14_3_um_filter_43_564]|nr:SlyX family protein [Thiomicrospira sp.]OIP95683.1 MAG: SlyX protein [Thiomicrospira sp. CG2_30_44_34]PIQ05411.1 MAG: SlyX protein [Piscirickettsiaceae bacterium CG18_big_fil_WC_8_21_14_2_50_44_103]PIU38259.1 MAG: SlyX protein [Piscirickettsiaceae bacterium CG07_land_8_20_14_0_80_44_28]PIW57622.1 MAG: SlyX protein [Piscirickettsiaceae bacterium CG12_big_fil_rev_8_21_14_0_65_44_934]PIW77366.1 MAG: SlyX protein [Piscirickettsiaceae bacterium CG_4_8_14_3_um_filter_44_38]PIX80229.1 MAG: SlyX p
MANEIKADTLQQKIESLEIRSAYQEDMLDHLNDAIGQQHLEIQQLKSQLQFVSSLLKQLKNDMGAEIKRPSEETPPPHY